METIIDTHVLSIVNIYNLLIAPIWNGNLTSVIQNCVQKITDTFNRTNLEWKRLYQSPNVLLNLCSLLIAPIWNGNIVL